MRVMVLIKATDKTEQGVMPSEQMMRDMMAYNEELVRAGVILAGEGLQPSAKGARVVFDGQQTTVIDGPFTETKELLAGFWLWQVKSLDEAVEWARRIPNTDGDHSEVEIRPVFETEDFADVAPPEIIEKERQMRERTGDYAG